MKSETLPDNPIPVVLENIPDELTVIDYRLLDRIRSAIFMVTDSKSFVTDAYVMLLLSHLNRAGVINLHVLSNIEGIDGDVYVVKKGQHGQST